MAAAGKLLQCTALRQPSGLGMGIGRGKVQGRSTEAGRARPYSGRWLTAQSYPEADYGVATPQRNRESAAGRGSVPKAGERIHSGSETGSVRGAGVAQ